MSYTEDEKLEISKKRAYKIVKSNDIVQKARYDLNLRELKVMSYIFSMVKPTDKLNQWYEFTIIDYCKVCGIDYKSGQNYLAVKVALQALRNKSFWSKLNNSNKVTTIGWLAKAEISPYSGKIAVKLDEDMQKYVIGTFDSYTQYELLSTLPMQSQYSFRIYELLKSYAYQKKHRFVIDELKGQLAAEHYKNFKDFRRFVLEIATREINEYTDLEVSWEPETKGRKVIAVIFTIIQRDSWGKLESSQRAEAALDKSLNKK